MHVGQAVDNDVGRYAAHCVTRPPRTSVPVQRRRRRRSKSVVADNKASVSTARPPAGRLRRRATSPDVLRPPGRACERARARPPAIERRRRGVHCSVTSSTGRYGRPYGEVSGARPPINRVHPARRRRHRRRRVIFISSFHAPSPSSSVNFYDCSVDVFNV